MAMEADFFNAQPFQAPPRQISLIVVDFDDTCSASDTIGLICQTAIAAAVKQAGEGEFAESIRRELEGTVRGLVTNYAARRNALLEEILPEVGGATGDSGVGYHHSGLVTHYAARRSALLEEVLPEVEEPPEEFDMGWLGDFIDRLSEFDREMNKVVIDSGILAGIKKGALSDTGAAIAMKAGCLELLQRAVKAGIPTCVLSVNWSAEMVRSALAQRGLPAVVAEDELGSALQAECAMVVANELEYFGDQSTGSIKRRVECAADKGHVFDDLLLNMAMEGSAPEGVTVVIGDSMTDIPALISADVGILLGSDTLVQQVALAAGIDIVPLVSAPLDANEQRDHSQCILYAAASWQEIEAFMFGSQFRAPPKRISSLKESDTNVTLGKKVPRVLAIAGSDSGGGAGIQADIKACAALGVYAATAVTALTAQNTKGVEAVHVTPTDFVRRQISAVLSDIGADVIKTGMLPMPEVVLQTFLDSASSKAGEQASQQPVVEAVAEALQQHAMGCVVVDPVTVSTSGDALATQGVVEAIQTHLLPIATIVTPNIPEASALLGGKRITYVESIPTPPYPTQTPQMSHIAGGKRITDVESMRHAAREIHQFGCQYVLVKGGHLATMDGGVGEGSGPGGPPMVTDVLFDGRNFLELSEPYIRAGNTHGTGCTLASAIAAELAKGRDMPSAVKRAKRYLWRVVERSVGLPMGKGVQRPMNHCYRLADWAAELASAGGSEGQQAEQAQQLPQRIPNSCDLRVYAVTDPNCNEQWGRGNAEAVRLAIDGGTTIVQLREKKCDGGHFAQQAAEVLEVCRSRQVPLLINDRVDVALAVDADGVHVGQNDIAAALVRRMIGPDKLLGVSVKTVEEALKAEADGADYLGAGAVYPTGTKESDVIGLDTLAQICKAVRIPVVSIGGIKASNASDAIAAGAAGAAVVSGIFAAENPADAAREIRQIVDEALAQRQASS
ncbi:hypothetical protein N2152v2_002888 [Parachlorella kessleri]